MTWAIIEVAHQRKRDAAITDLQSASPARAASVGSMTAAKS